jgi:hypothetical protein
MVCEGRGKREEGRGKREEGRGKREEEVVSDKSLCGALSFLATDKRAYPRG